MKNDLLANRHIGISKRDEEQMLRKIGVASLDDLIEKPFLQISVLKSRWLCPKR